MILFVFQPNRRYRRREFLSNPAFSVANDRQKELSIFGPNLSPLLPIVVLVSTIPMRPIFFQDELHPPVLDYRLVPAS
jgi:hypothetical protein